MSVLVDRDTRLCVSGITGREGTFHAKQMREPVSRDERFCHAGKDALPNSVVPCELPACQRPFIALARACCR